MTARKGVDQEASQHIGSAIYKACKTKNKNHFAIVNKIMKIASLNKKYFNGILHCRLIQPSTNVNISHAIWNTPKYAAII